MYRKIMSFFETWKESKHRKPLILQGARQVGKTYPILEFGRTHYENVTHFNFETNPRLNKTFEENISPDYLIPILSYIAGQTIVKEKTLIVFDEIQLCERALTSLKYQRDVLIPCRKSRYENPLSIIQRGGKLIPIEVKSADNLKAKSLKVYMETYKPDYAIKLSPIKHG